MNESVNPTGLVIPPEIATLLDKPPLLRGENRALYDQRLAALAALWRPSDFMSWKLMGELADADWEVTRYKSYKALVVNAGSKDAVYSLADMMSDADDHETVAAQTARGYFRDVEVKKRVAGELAHYGLTDEAILAQALVQRIDSIDKIDRLLSAAERRRKRAEQELALYLEDPVWQARRQAIQAGVDRNDRR